MLSWATTELSILTYGMTIAGIIMSIISFNINGQSVDDFREYLRQAAVSNLSAVSFHSILVPGPCGIILLCSFF